MIVTSTLLSSMDLHYSQPTFLDIMSSTYSPVSSSVPDLVADTSNISDINDLFDFEGFASDVSITFISCPPRQFNFPDIC